MKISYLKLSNKAIYFFILSTFLYVVGIQAQNKNIKKPDSIQVVNKAIAIENISDETEKLSQRIIQLRKILLPSKDISEVDSLLSATTSEINIKRDSLIKSLELKNRRLLKVDKVTWENYRSKIKSYQKTIKDRTENITEINDEIISELKKWEQTKEQFTSSNESKDLFNNLDLAITTLQEILDATHERLDYIYNIQKKLTDIILIIDEVIVEIELVELQMRKDYFVFDSKPIWESNDVNTTSLDTLNTLPIDKTNPIWLGIQENKKQIKDFVSLNVKILIFQIIFILILFILIVRVNIKWKENISKLTNPIEKQAKIVLKHPISATIVSGVLISAFFYDALIPAFAEFHILLILIATVFLLPILTHKSFRLFLVLLFFVYLLQTFQAYLNNNTGLVRILILIDAVILISAIGLGRKIILKYPNNFERIYKLFKVLTPFYITFLVLAIVANIIGMVSLSSFLVTGILLSTSLGFVIYLVVKVITSLFILFFKFRRATSLQTFSTLINVTHKRIQPILNWLGLFVWLLFTLNGFDLLDFIINWFNELMLIHWKIGEMTIFLGGILAFIGIFISTLIIAKVAASIFQDAWMVEVLPRGVAPAISLLLRIFVISIGLYMALSVAGIDLSSLGFMLGALGVGIGFGLQNVVLNFVAGLILAFERPINLGDTIEVDQEFGVVTNIGVRSSSIKSYAGYEAIIPNGDLISKKVINYTLSNRDRRSKINMKTAASADPEKIIKLCSEIAAEHPNTHKVPEPNTFFYGYDSDGNLSFTLLYWTTFSETLKTDNDIALKIFSKLKEEGIQAPAPVRRIIDEK
ncbi:MAG: mechanosensitive ion channel [Flavobacteriaceae bacterium]|nr:mechanosensitive ion channel [Flavobacteriaceae bacterium]